MHTIPDIFRTQAARNPDKLCLRLYDSNTAFTYAQLHALLCNKSTLFGSRYGLQRGATIAIVADNSLEYLITAYAAMYAGLGVLVISTRSLPAHLAYFLQRAEVAHVFCSDTQRAACTEALAVNAHDANEHRADEHSADEHGAGAHITKAYSTKAYSADTTLSDLSAFTPTTADLHADPALLQAAAGPDADSTAVILHTSGTTRTPKLVYLSHRNILANQRASAGAFHTHWTQDAVSLGWLPLFHGYALLAEFLCDMLAGGTLVLYPAAGQLTADQLLQALQRSGSNVLCCVPWMLNLLQERITTEGDAGPALQQLQQLKFIVTGGSSLGSATGSFFRERGVRIVTMFGLSEAAGFVLHSPFDGSAWDELQPNARSGVEFRPVSDGGREHELVITDNTLYSGTVLFPPGDGAAHAQRSELATGDLFVRKGSGWCYLGRGDQIYNGAHGEKVNPLLFEQALEQFPGVQRAFVYGAELAYNVALVQLTPAQAADAAFTARLRQHIQDCINPALEHPDRVYPGDVMLLESGASLPLTPKGSVDRRAAADLLRQRLAARPAAARQGVASADDVVAIFRQELANYCHETDAATLAASTLLELGFDSLMTLSLRNNLQERLQLQIPVDLLLSYPPLREFEAALVQLNAAARESSSAEPQHAGDPDGWRGIALEQVVFHKAYYLFPGPTFGGSFSLVAPRQLTQDAIVRGLQFLERNHEVLRSIYRPDGSFRIVDYSMVQRANIGHFSMQGEHDLNRNLPVQDLIQQHLALQPYDFDAGPAWRYATVDITDGAGHTRSMLFIGLNHIIGDFRSFSLSVREFMRYIDGSITAADVVPDDYRGALHSATPQQFQRLQAAMQTLLTAGFDTLPKGVDLRRGARLRFTFPHIDMTALGKVFRAHNLSVFNGVHAAWVYAASRHIDGLQSDDFPAVTSVTTRITKALESVMGCFVYTPVYRFRLPPQASMKQAALQVQQATLAAFTEVLVDPVAHFERALQNPRNLLPIIKRNIVLYRSPDELIDPVPHWGCYRNDYFEDRCNVGAYFDFCGNKQSNAMEGYLTVNLLFCSAEIAQQVLDAVELLLLKVLQQPALDFSPDAVLQQHESRAQGVAR